MSALRDIRLLVARHLNLSPNTNAAILDVLNLLDASLDAEGYEHPPEVTQALKRLDHVIIFGEDLPDEEALSEDPLDSEDLVDIDDIFFDNEDDNEDDDE